MSKELIELQEYPQLKNPRMIIAWPDTGHVGIRVIDYFRNKLEAKKFGQVLPYNFALVPWISVKDGLIETAQFMRNEFYYWKNEQGDHDLVLLKSEQPTSMTYEYVNSVLDVVEQLGVKRIYLAGSFGATGIDHTEPAMVLGVVNRPYLREFLKDHDVKAYPEYKGVGNIHSTLLWFARERTIEAVSLWSPMPYYIARLPFPWSNYPKCSVSIVEKISAMENIQIDVTELKSLVEQTEREMRKVYEELREEAGREVGISSSGQFGEQSETGEDPISDEDVKRIMGDLEDFFKNGEL